MAADTGSQLVESDEIRDERENLRLRPCKLCAGANVQGHADTTNGGNHPQTKEQSAMTTIEDRVYDELAELFARHARPPDRWALGALPHLERDLIGACWALRAAEQAQPARSAWLAGGGLTVTATIIAAWALVSTSKDLRTSYRLRAQTDPSCHFGESIDPSEVELAEELVARLRTVVDAVLRIYGGTEPVNASALHKRAFAWHQAVREQFGA